MGGGIIISAFRAPRPAFSPPSHLRLNWTAFCPYSPRMSAENKMHYPTLTRKRVRHLLDAAGNSRVLVVGDVMLDHFIWGSVARISPEAPVPVVDFERESFMPGGAANAARNLTALRVNTELFGTVGHDQAAGQLKQLLQEQNIGCA